MAYTVRDKTVQMFCKVRMFLEYLMNNLIKPVQSKVVGYHVTNNYQFELLHNLYLPPHNINILPDAEHMTLFNLLNKSKVSANKVM